ncbi:MAG TPA: VOC family protein [Acidimicrobiales bacterium]|nr:VOC family protein [Acidimicrobiales bacterium]
MAVLAGLAVADPAELWSELGFSVTAGSCRVGTVDVAFGAPGSGVVSWALAAVEPGPGAGGALDGLPTTYADGASPGCPPGRHDNGVTGIDHVVVATPDLERTVGVLACLGVTERRRRDAGRPGGRPVTQVFFRLGEVILELVGPPEPAGDGPARFYGLAFQVSDLEATAAVLGPRLRPVQPAVQPGRFIATLDRSAGSTVDMAFMS